ncbi:hypothetical protein P3T35_007473 [Kitasatospora sp. GP30]|nr:hypothetical protein [Kitasatospora sp. GP30]
MPCGKPSHHGTSCAYTCITGSKGDYVSAGISSQVFGAEMSVVVTDVERPQRRVFLSRSEDSRHSDAVPLR